MSSVIAVVTDLFFQSRIAAAARAAGRDAIFLVSPQAMADEEYDLALVDLDARLDVNAMIGFLKSRGINQVVAFGPHLDTDKRKAARKAGADRVLARSKFVTELLHLMNDRPDASGTDPQIELDAALAEIHLFGQRLRELGQILQDPAQVVRLVFAPEPHMKDMHVDGDPIVLNAGDYLPFLAVESVRAKLNRIRDLRTQSGDARSVETE